MRKLNLRIVLILTVVLSTTLSLMAQDMSKVHDTKRFARPVNTGANHTLLILDESWGELKPNIGDEIAAYDAKGNMVASIVYVGHHTGLALWGDDEYTEEKEGLAKGEQFSLKWWKKDSNQMLTLNADAFERGNDQYMKDGLTVISQLSVNQTITQELELFQNVPNPVSDFTAISFYLPNKSEVHLSLHNNLGQEILVIANAQFEEGSHTVDMKTLGIEPGVYFYKLRSGNEKITKQMTVVK